ncbi:hypothetical protein C900_05367 [Fulvivirga imtechensis AK7]|uniref:Uncharacterized protein n=1 Tax=Fulvivirga imtechensis AK7 TaxID=1237149 RepID=L8JJT7_9BACT|nr:hypothetical protein [Fulvivirga imtechensis]ELR69171.1 hypothetical protein C900_05367 [Fulvivirga imtechensis AK7]
MAKKEAQALAKSLYLHSNKTQDEIAAIVGVTNKTMTKWVQPWKNIKQARNLLPDQQVAKIYTQLEALDTLIEAQDNIPTSKQADIKKKLTAAIKDIQNVSLKEYVLCYEELLNHIKPIDLDLAKRLVDQINDFLLMKAEQMES